MKYLNLSFWDCERVVCGLDEVVKWKDCAGN